MDYVHKLAYPERPDYELLRGMFHEVGKKKGEKHPREIFGTFETQSNLCYY